MCPPPPSFCWTSSEKCRRTLSHSTPGPPSPYTAGQQLLLSTKRPLGSGLTSPLPPCSNGIGRSGVFIALHILLERMVAEGLVDAFQTIKNLRIQRPAMVQTLVSLTPSLCPTIDSTFVEDVTAALPSPLQEQYQFCYTATLDYLESSDLINQLRSSTRSDTRSLKGVSNASELRSSQRSLARNDSLRSSTKRSSRNFELGQVGNGVSTTVYGGSEATSTFGTTQQPAFNDCPYSQRPLRGAADLGDGSGTPVLPSTAPSCPPRPPPAPACWPTHTWPTSTPLRGLPAASPSSPPARALLPSSQHPARPPSCSPRPPRAPTTASPVPRATGTPSPPRPRSRPARCPRGASRWPRGPRTATGSWREARPHIPAWASQGATTLYLASEWAWPAPLTRAWSGSWPHWLSTSTTLTIMLWTCTLNHRPPCSI